MSSQRVPTGIGDPSSFREPLPPDCPPEDAEDAFGDLDVYRLVRTDPPTDADFHSQRHEQSTARFTGVTECQARGLSVFLDVADATKRLTIPKFSTRKVCRVRLGAGAGPILRTGTASHHTWWPLAGYDIIGNSTVD